MGRWRRRNAEFVWTDMGGVTPGALLDSQAPGPSSFGQRVATLLHVDDLLSKVMDLLPVWQAKNWPWELGRSLAAAMIRAM